MHNSHAMLQMLPPGHQPQQIDANLWQRTKDEQQMSPPMEQQIMNRSYGNAPLQQQQRPPPPPALPPPPPPLPAQREQPAQINGHRHAHLQQSQRQQHSITGTGNLNEPQDGVLTNSFAQMSFGAKPPGRVQTPPTDGSSTLTGHPQIDQTNNNQLDAPQPSAQMINQQERSFVNNTSPQMVGQPFAATSFGQFGHQPPLPSPEPKPQPGTMPRKNMTKVIYIICFC